MGISSLRLSNCPMHQEWHFTHLNSYVGPTVGHTQWAQCGGQPPILFLPINMSQLRKLGLKRRYRQEVEPGEKTLGSSRYTNGSKGDSKSGFYHLQFHAKAALLGPSESPEVAACQQLSSAYIILRLLKYSGFPLVLFSLPQGDMHAVQWAAVLFLPSAFPLEFGSRSTSEPFLPGECSRVCSNSPLRQKHGIYYLSKY